MSDPVVVQELKRDTFGRVELLEAGGLQRARRVACGGRMPGSRAVAHLLMARERRALDALDGLAGVPARVEGPEWVAAASLDGGVPDPRDVLLRSWQAGSPLHLAEALPTDFFEHLRALVERLHERGVCHNDLHKEQNVVVGPDGRPALIDFQLASVHRRGGRSFRTRVHDDLRHVQKHERRYTRLGRGPGGELEREADGGAPRLARSPTAAVWRRTIKPLYNLVTRRLLRTRDGEARRDSRGPWPVWTPALGQGPGASALEPRSDLRP